MAYWRVQMTYSIASVQQQYAIDAHRYGNQPPRHRADALTKTCHAGLDADADQFVCDERRVRPLHLAAECKDRRRSLRTCIALLESGCDAQCADYEGRTCLHVVAERGPRGLVELLMDAGCSKEAEDVHGRKPADAAEAAGQAKIAEIIRGYKDPVLKVGGSVGISKRMEFLETGQLKLDGVGADRGGGGSLRASAKKLRKDLFAKLKGKKKYKAGMTKPKKPPVLPEIRFPSDAETYKPWVRYVSEAGEPYWSLSRVFIGASTLSMRPRLAAKLPPTAPSPRGYPTVTPSPRRVLTRRRHRRHNPETDASTWDEPPKYIPAPKGEARVTSAEKRARAQAKKAKRQAHRRRLAAAPVVGDEPALMDAPSPIATTPEARSRQLRALKRADSARRAATPAAGSRGATPQQFSPTNAVGMGALFAPGGDVTPVRRSARSSRASSTPGEDLPPEAARFVAQVMSPEQSRPGVVFYLRPDAIDAALVHGVALDAIDATRP